LKTNILLISILLGLTTVSAKEKTSYLSKNPKVMSKQTATTKVAAKPAQDKATTAQPSAKQPSALSTDVHFGDQSVGGKYQLPMEALSVVENEKSIDDLIGVRKNFRDRVARTKGMR